MATFRNQPTDSYALGAAPPEIRWTVVRGDSAAFRVYVTNDAREPLLLEDWEVAMDIYRPSTSSVVLTLNPGADEDDGPGEFTVYLAHDESEILETDDRFDIQMATTGYAIVWTVLQGSIKMIEDFTE
jgi:hypothetical protein